MKLIDNRLGRFVLRRWSSEEDMGFNIVVTVPRRLSIFQREKIARLEAVDRAIRLQTALRHVEFLEAELENAQGALDREQDARADMRHLISKVDDLVGVVHMYQQSLKTLRAPDPHETRVKAVFGDFYRAFKDEYEQRHDG